MKRFVLLLSLLFWLAACPAHGQSPVADLAYFNDVSGRMTVENVRQQPFTAFHGVLSHPDGQDGTVTWMRITVRGNGDLLLLFVKQLFAERVELYEQSEDGRWVANEDDGNSWLVSHSQLRSMRIFEIYPHGNTVYYLRVSGKQSNIVEIQVSTPSEWYVSNLRQQVYQALFIGLMLAILFWAASDFIVRKEPLVGLFAAAQFMQVLFSLTSFGYLETFLSVSFGSRVQVIVPVTMAAIFLFHRQLVHLFKPNRWALYLLDALLTLTLIEIVMVLAGISQLALQLGVATQLLFIPTLLWLAYSARMDALPGRLALRVTYTALALALAVSFLPWLGWTRGLDVYQNALALQGFAGAIIIGIFLYQRSSAMQKHALEARLKLEQTEQGLRLHQMQVQEQRQFIDMLSHELKTPIGVIQITLDTMDLPDKKRQRLEKALKTMSDIIDRCRLSTQLEEKKLTVDDEYFDIQDLVEDVVDGCTAPDRVDLKVNSALVRADYRLLSVVVQNLVDNALKYSPSDTRIKVEQGSEKGKFVKGVTLTVTNTYLGDVPPDNRLIFEKYVRGPTSAGLSGSGLGLHLSRSIVEMLGGSLNCQVIGREIEFTLWLPSDPGDAHQTEARLGAQ